MVAFYRPSCVGWPRRTDREIGDTRHEIIVNFGVSCLLSRISCLLSLSRVSLESFEGVYDAVQLAELIDEEEVKSAALRLLVEAQ